MPAHPQRGDLRVLRGPKILLRTLASEISAFADLDGDLMPLMGEAGAIALQIEDADSLSLLAHEALFNSAFYQWWLGGMALPRQAGWLALNVGLVAAMPVPTLAEDDLDRLAQMAKDIRDTLDLNDPLRRLAEYHRCYAHLDQFVLDLLGASLHLQAIVAEELRRTV